jgi:hypothetical protein
VGSEEAKSFIRISKNGLQRKFGKCRGKDVDERQRTSTAKLVGSKNGGRLFAPRRNFTRVTTTLEVSSKRKGSLKNLFKNRNRARSGSGVSGRLRRPGIFCMVSGSSEMISYGSPNVRLTFA